MRIKTTCDPPPESRQQFRHAPAVPSEFNVLIMPPAGFRRKQMQSSLPDSPRARPNPVPIPIPIPMPVPIRIGYGTHAAALHSRNCESSTLDTFLTANDVNFHARQGQENSPDGIRGDAFWKCWARFVILSKIELNWCVKCALSGFDGCQATIVVRLQICLQRRSIPLPHLKRLHQASL